MTGAVTVNVPVKKLGVTGTKAFETPLYLDGTLSLGEGTYYLTLFPQFLLSRTIHKGSLVYIKFDDESVITVPVEVTDRSRRTVAAAFTQSSKEKIYNNTLLIRLTDESIALLKTKKIIKIRCDTEDYNLKGKEQKLISEWIICMQEAK
jgi:hypothetical protein